MNIDQIDPLKQSVGGTLGFVTRWCNGVVNMEVKRARKTTVFKHTRTLEGELRPAVQPELVGDTGDTCLE